MDEDIEVQKRVNNFVEQLYKLRKQSWCFYFCSEFLELIYSERRGFNKEFLEVKFKVWVKEGVSESLRGYSLSFRKNKERVIF